MGNLIILKMQNHIDIKSVSSWKHASYDWIHWIQTKLPFFFFMSGILRENYRQKILEFHLSDSFAVLHFCVQQGLGRLMLNTSLVVNTELYGSTTWPIKGWKGQRSEWKASSAPSENWNQCVAVSLPVPAGSFCHSFIKTNRGKLN